LVATLKAVHAEDGAYVFIAGRRQAELDKAVADIGKNVSSYVAGIDLPVDGGLTAV
jgi:hypothetical protein